MSFDLFTSKLPAQDKCNELIEVSEVEHCFQPVLHTFCGQPHCLQGQRIGGLISEGHLTASFKLQGCR